MTRPCDSSRTRPAKVSFKKCFVSLDIGPGVVSSCICLSVAVTPIFRDCHPNINRRPPIRNFHQPSKPNVTNAARPMATTPDISGTYRLLTVFFLSRGAIILVGVTAGVLSYVNQLDQTRASAASTSTLRVFMCLLLDEPASLTSMDPNIIRIKLSALLIGARPEFL